ncbi:hypothetical protein C440_17011 [Haloferax mucosum ATCC BAA-1512]|uniref:Uncharacterized protein n=1 Tax=Haloferax mucosum ATCC BAA-1512 TaxID=662479 RepID=M0I4T8_9EURY|nr:hypothetical protein C440_17011 [Haloferax mucosum ATCC BAA-1512]
MTQLPSGLLWSQRLEQPANLFGRFVCGNQLMTCREKIIEVVRTAAPSDVVEDVLAECRIVSRFFSGFERVTYVAREFGENTALMVVLVQRALQEEIECSLPGHNLLRVSKPFKPV